jgi:hypothetical protein
VDALNTNELDGITGHEDWFLELQHESGVILGHENTTEPGLGDGIGACSGVSNTNGAVGMERIVEVEHGLVDNRFRSM